MTREKITLILVILILIANIMLFSLPNVFYGFHSLFGYDLFGRYGAVNGIYYRNVPLEESHIYEGVLEPYPPGFDAFLASIKFLTDFDTFQLDFFFKILYTVLLVLLIFIIAIKAGKKYAITALFATSAFYLSIHTSMSGCTTIGSVTLLGAGTRALSNIFTLIAVYSIICIFSKEKSMKRDIPYYTLLFLTFTAHGVSHVGGVVMEISLLAFILMLFLIYYLFNGGKQFLTKSINIASIISLSFAFQFLIHWKTIMDYLNAQGVLYSDVEHYFGISIHIPFIMNSWFLIVILFAISVFGFTLSKALNNRYLYPRFNAFFKGMLKHNHWYIIIIICGSYVIAYMYGIIKGGPMTSLRGGTDFIFTLYFGPPYSSVTILTKFFGLFLYILSLIGVLFFIKQTNIYAKLIGYIYLSQYFVSFISLPFPVHPARIIYGLALLYPFALAGAIIYLWDIFKDKSLHLHGYTIKKFYSISLCGMIVFLIISAQVIILINKEPTVIEHDFPENIPFKFGTTSPPVISNELVCFVNTQIEQNSHILATGDTQRTLSSVTSIKPIFVGWTRGAPSTLNVVFLERYEEVYNAMSYIDSKYFNDYIEKYNVTYMIVLPGDLNTRAITTRVGLSGATLQKYFNSKLSRVYTTSYGEVVYTYSNNS